jgi:DNA-binding XRE family transcriptional regulator
MNNQRCIAKEIGKNIQKYRCQQDLTQEDLADMLGISRVYMGYIEQGRNNPSLPLLHKVAKKLKVKVQELL